MGIIGTVHRQRRVRDWREIDLAAVTVRLTLLTIDEAIRTQVADFAKGLGCRVEAATRFPAGELTAVLPDTGDALLELLTHVALTATKSGTDISEPVCRVAYRRQSTSPEVVLSFRLTDFNISSSADRSRVPAKV